MTDQLERARALADEGSWADARDVLAGVDPGELGAADHERLAVAAGLTGRLDLGDPAWERAHHGYLEDHDIPRAARAAFWLGLSFVVRGQHAQAGGWIGRAKRLLDESGIECAETGRLLIPEALQLLSRDPAGALELFQRALDFAATYDDPEVAAFARLGCGQAHIKLGQAEQGVALFDEAMVAATTDDVSPIAVGIIYCAVILDCHRIFDLRRAREWTAALDRWSQRQQGLVPFRGQCLVHRSEMAQARGDWDDAVDEVEAACSHLSEPAGDPVLGLALYQRAELHRLRGEFDEADEDYGRGAELGRRDAPGRQLLLLARGRVDEAATSIRVALETAAGPTARARLLGAHVEIMLAVDDVDSAEAGAAELEDLAEKLGTPTLAAVADVCTAMVDLAKERPSQAVGALHRAEAAWRDLGVPYEVGRIKALEARAYDQLGDGAAAKAARDAARSIFEQLGAGPDLAALDTPNGATPDAPTQAPGGLSPREVEVVRLVAAGMTNREIAEALVISEKTVARHLSNLFTKLGVGTRTAASAWAWEQGIARR